MACSRCVCWAIHIVEVDVEVSGVVAEGVCCCWWDVEASGVFAESVCIVVSGVAEVAGEGSEQTNENMA